MSYLRPMGDGPVTSPSQVDSGPITSPSQVATEDEILIGDVNAKRVPCSELPADSPWRQPGRVCAADFNIVDMFTGLINKLGAAFATTPSPTAAPGASAIPVAVLLGGAATAAYFLLRKKKRT